MIVGLSERVRDSEDGLVEVVDREEAVNKNSESNGGYSRRSILICGGVVALALAASTYAPEIKNLDVKDIAGKYINSPWLPYIGIFGVFLGSAALALRSYMKSEQ